MKKLTLFCLVVTALQAQKVNYDTTNVGFQDFHLASWRPPERTVSALPSASGSTGWIFNVTDGTSATDCTTGGGSTFVSSCRSNGTIWVNVGGGGGGTSANVGNCAPTNVSSNALQCGTVTGFTAAPGAMLILSTGSITVPTIAGAVTITVNAATYTLLGNTGSGLQTGQIFTGSPQMIVVLGSTTAIVTNDVLTAGSSGLVSVTKNALPYTVDVLLGPGQLCKASGTCSITGLQSLVSSSAQALTAPTAILGNANNVQITASGSITLTATPTMAAAVTDGTGVIVTNVGSNPITLQDRGTLTGSLLSLCTSSITLAAGQSIKLGYNATLGYWVKEGCAGSGSSGPSLLSGAAYSPLSTTGATSEGPVCTLAAPCYWYFPTPFTGGLKVSKIAIDSYTGQASKDGTLFIMDSNCNLVAGTTTTTITSTVAPGSGTGVLFTEPSPPTLTGTGYFIGLTTNCTICDWVTNGQPNGEAAVINIQGGSAIYAFTGATAATQGGGAGTTITAPATCGTRTALTAASALPLLFKIFN